MKTILTTLAIGRLLFCVSAHAQYCAAAPAAGIKVMLRITGMTCDKCAAGVEKALKKVEGVKAAEVSLEKKRAVVTVDAAKVKTDRLIAAVDKAGGDRHTFKAEKAQE